MKVEILKATTIRGAAVEAGSAVEVDNKDFEILNLQRQARVATDAPAKAKQGK